MKHTKLLVAIILLSVLFSCEKSDSVDKVSKSIKCEEFSSNLNESVKCVCFVDDNHGFAGGYGKIFKTTDGGLTWKSDSITDMTLYSIYFIDSKTGFVGGYKGHSAGSVIFKTIDSGEHWNKLNIPAEYSELNSLWFINENIGFAIGLGIRIKTVDGGETWEKFEMTEKELSMKIKFINSNIGFCAGAGGDFYKTLDQGENWVKIEHRDIGYIHDFSFVNEDIGYAVGANAGIIKTVDGGETWTFIENSPLYVRFIHFFDELNGITIGESHYTGGDWGFWTKALHKTNDGGETWEKEDNIEFRYETSFYDTNNGYSIVPYKTLKIGYK